MIAVCAATMIAGALILHPVEYERLARSFLAALAFAANLYFYQTSNYFGPTASELPLLHLWSLGIEEQFYFVFPLLAVALFKIKRGLAVSVYVGLLVLSLILSQYMAGQNPPAAFYLLPFRAFQLLIGTVLATRIIPRTSNRWIASGACIVGLLSIGWSYHYLDQPPNFPGWRALPSCMGAALVIWSGNCVATLPSKVVGNPLFALVGRLSYSLYLIHWPVLFFVPRVHAENGWLVLAVTFTLSALSYRFIESPFRHARWSSRRKIKLATVATTIAALSAIIVTATGGFASRADSKAAYYMSFLKYQNGPQFGAPDCFIDYLQDFTSLAPRCLAPSEKPVLLIWGDSGIAQYSSALTKIAEERGMVLRQATASGCPPALDLVIADRPQCKGFNRDVLQSVIKLRPALVVLGAAWNARMEVYPHVEITLHELRQSGITTIVLGLGPGYKSPVPMILADRNRANNNRMDSGDDLLRHWLYTTDDAFRARIETLGFKYVSILRHVCPSSECPLLVNGTPVHFDTAHVTDVGAELFARQFSTSLLGSWRTPNVIFRK